MIKEQEPIKMLVDRRAKERVAVECQKNPLRNIFENGALNEI
jgi:hypothetical protein